MKDLAGFVEKVLSDLAGLPEDAMRLGLLGRRLKALDPRHAALLIDAICRKGRGGRSSRMALMALVDPEGLKSALGEEKCALIYLASIELGLQRVSRLFTDLQPRKKGLAGYDSEEDAGMEFITPGERRAMARGFKKDSLLRLLSDPDPAVIGNLLNNPRITEKDVVRMASRRPASPGILRLIAGHRIWSKRYGVIRALVLNPYTPPRISIALLEVLPAQDLGPAAEDGSLHPQVRLAASEILKDRNGGDRGQTF